jgi:hypothetical protein
VCTDNLIGRTNTNNGKQLGCPLIIRRTRPNNMSIHRHVLMMSYRMMFKRCPHTPKTTSHVDNHSCTCALVAHIGAMPLKKEVTKNNNHHLKQIALTNECIDFCLIWTKKDVHLFLMHSL